MGNLSMYSMERGPVTAVIIPCYRCEKTIQAVVQAIPDSVHLIVCVDDCSDDETATVLSSLVLLDPRVCIITNKTNKGVGGATVAGYRHAIELGAEILVKLDSDGQMNPEFIDTLIGPIVEGEADYTKGNRFFDLEAVCRMPMKRLIGNAGLSLLTKLATGYWNLFDPTNGFTAMHAEVAKALPLHKLHKRYFFESDLLFRLATVRARVMELPMMAVYGDEKSNLSEMKSLLTFPGLHARNFGKRIVYSYFLRGFSAASLSLLAGIPLLLFGFFFGLTSWIEGAQTGTPATAGTVMLSAVPLLMGFQLLLSFLQHDVASVPDDPIHRRTTGLRKMEDTVADNKRMQMRDDRRIQTELNELRRRLDKTIH